MSEELLALIERARGVVMTTEDRLEQAVSFAYGNVALENPAVTRDSVRRASERLRSRAGSHAASEKRESRHEHAGEPAAR